MIKQNYNQSGKIFKMKDGRTVVLYDFRPLLKQGKLVLNIVDEKMEMDCAVQILLMSPADFNLKRATGELEHIGFVD